MPPPSLFAARGATLRRTHPMVPAVGLILLLAALGGLQYHWLRQVGDAERARLQHDARRRADALAQDFDREITRAYVMLQVPPDPGKQPGAAFAQRWDRWTSRAPHPAIVSAVYLLDPPRTASALSRYDPSARSFVPAQWPPELEPLRRRLGEVGAPAPPMPVEPGIPALLSPVPDVIAMDDRREPVTEGADVKRVLFHRRAGPWPAWGCTIVVLDRDRLERLMAELAARHLAGAAEEPAEYDLTLLGGADGPVLWSSGSPRARGDAEAPVLQVRFDDLERSVVDALAEGASPDSPRGGAHFTMRLATGVVAALGSGGQPAPSGWHVVLTHRAGSVDALAAALRRRNLALSFGILGVLAASIALVVASSQRARRLAARQIEFVAGVSHELRTPVAVIRSAAENLADGVVTEPSQVRKYGEVILDQGARLTGMVEHVLALAGGQARAKDPQRVPPAELVRGALQDQDSDLESAGMPLQVEVPADLPDVGGDPEALRRALGNLVANARRHAEGSALRVRARRADDGGVEIDVEDHGPGIDPADLPHLFEPFYRGRRAVAEQVPGTGLGLAIVRGVTEAHGGRVTVRSRPGAGATFTLHLPAFAPR